MKIKSRSVATNCWHRSPRQQQRRVVPRVGEGGRFPDSPSAALHGARLPAAARAPSAPRGSPQPIPGPRAVGAAAGPASSGREARGAAEKLCQTFRVFPFLPSAPSPLPPPVTEAAGRRAERGRWRGAARWQVCVPLREAAPPHEAPPARAPRPAPAPSGPAAAAPVPPSPKRDAEGAGATHSWERGGRGRRHLRLPRRRRS